MSQYNNLLNCLRNLLGILELAPTSQLYQDTIAICNYLENPVYRLAVFAPFNHGKSTLLNALLNSKTLPIDLIPTTGAAIIVGYGEKLATQITCKDGKEIKETGTKILQEYAVLDSDYPADTLRDRRMNEKVAEVKVFCPHPWLKTGVEFLDLPGTNDREALNDLVRDKLLGADLIIHVLDARKLMTLEEREHLQNWLQKRGITTVIFVVNFLNLLTLEERKEVQSRLCFVAESFRSDLPTGISNIYCVDALPALRARLKGDSTIAQTTGLTTFESALQHIVSSQINQQVKLSRVFKIAEQLLNQALIKQSEILEIITVSQAKAEKQITIKQKAAQLIQQSFNRSLSDFQGWLYLPKLLINYQASLAIALQQTRFDQWLELEFKPNIFNYQQAINKLVEQGCDFFQYDQPQLLSIDFPESPIINIPEEYFPETPVNNNTSAKYNIPRELNLMLQNKMGAVLLGGASYVLNKVVAQPNSTDISSTTKATKISSRVYADAAEAYLKKISDRVNKVLTEYEKIALNYITFKPQITTNQTTTSTATNYQLQLLNNLINNLKNELANFQ
jgi:hypothetical protein